MLVGEKGPYTLVVQHDGDAASPREDDNFGKMVCFHRRYNLGDKHDYLDKDDFLRELYLDTVGNDEQGARRYERMLDMAYARNSDPNHPGSVERAVDERMLRVIEQKYIVLSLYLHDHSGLAMNTTGFADPWDSGQVGWVYASKEAALRDFGGGKVLTAEKREQTENLLRGEVEVYDAYLRGECYGFELYKNDFLEDSCWGFIGDLDMVRKDMEGYLPAACQGITDHLEEQEDRASMPRLFLKHAQIQIDQAMKALEHAPRQQAIGAEAR